MTKDLHLNPYDESTLIKLALFKKYLKLWLPVFLSKKTYPIINIFDFFAGPGRDNNGTAGSPIIIINEVNNYFNDSSKPKTNNIKLNIYLNEFDKNKFTDLSNEIDKLEKNYFSYNLTNLDFENAFKENINYINANHSANLIVLDQNGIKQITSDVFKTLVNCSATDILFFISSSYIKRFLSEESIKKYISLSTDEIEQVSQKDIHRFICHNYYKKLVPVDKKYYLAPFSIKKGTNIYGIIFGSNSLFGLEKFLTACWDLDKYTGEANYNIDDDHLRESAQMSLLPEDNIIKKQDEYRQTLINELKNKSLNNLEIYQLTLECGFLPKHAKKILEELQNSDKISVFDIKTKQAARKHSFYISWDYYKQELIRVEITLKD